MNKRNRYNTVPIKEHFDALRAADQRALSIKETADLAALQLARVYQTYRDEQANRLREQINSERGLYATKADLVQTLEKLEALIKPQAEYVSLQTGQSKGVNKTTGALLAIIAAAGTLVAIAAFLMTRA